MKTIIFILLVILLTSSLNSIGNNDSKIQKSDSNIKQRFYLTLGIGPTTGISKDNHLCSRFKMNLQRRKLIYALDISGYNALRLGDVPFYEGAVLSHNEAGVFVNRILLPPHKYKNFHLSLGSGISLIHQKVRDKPIYYENWTSKTHNYIGIPIIADFSFFFKNTHIVLNFCYKGVIYEKGNYHSIIMDLGFWFDN